MLVVEQLQRQALADRQALLSRGITEDLPTTLSAQQHFDDWLLAEREPAEPLTPEQLERREELLALGVAS